jgi:hypothetical protein
VQVAITDGCPRYKNTLQSHWANIAHQLWVVHLIKEVNQLILDGVRAIKNALRRQGNKGRKKRPGWPSNTVQQHRQRRQGMSKKEHATFIWEPPYLIVGKEAQLREEERADLALLFAIAAQREVFGASISISTGSLRKVLPSSKPAIGAPDYSTIPITRPILFWHGR